MDLHQIEIFCHLVRLRSFSKAAEALRLSQPTVSSHVKNLETNLGARLIDRIGRNVVPTEAGDILYHAGEKLLALRDQTRQEIAGICGTVSGQLKIGASPTPGAYVLPAIISVFKREHPTATLYLEIASSTQITEAVLHSDVHIGIVGVPSDDPRLEYYPYFEDEVVIVVPPHHPWARKKTISHATLEKEPFILHEKKAGSSPIMVERLEASGISLTQLNSVVIAGNTDAVREAVKAGLGVSILSLRAIQDDLKTKTLAAVRIKGVPLKTHFLIVMLKGKSRSLLCSAFLDTLQNGKKNIR